MRKSSIPASSFALTVGRVPTLNGTFVVAVGKKGPAFDAPAVDAPASPSCTDCADFECVVTRTGLVTCDNPVHAETKPQLPLRPTPHERDGRQDSPEPARPHRRAALLVG
ncbi:hypothetical protein [Streptomyces sp. NPDC002547]